MVVSGHGGFIDGKGVERGLNIIDTRLFALAVSSHTLLYSYLQ